MPSPKPTQQTDVRPWTLLVYMVSDDALDGSVSTDASGTPIVDLDTIAQLEREAILKAAQTRQAAVHVAIQLDLLKKPGTFRWLNGQPLKPLDESVSTDPLVLERFMKWGIEACPAERYAVLLWGHSSGPSGLFSDQTPSFGFSRILELPELGACLENVKKFLRDHGVSGDATRNEGADEKHQIAVLLFKDCFQSLLETAFELGRVDYERPERASFMIASQGLVPVATQDDASSGPKPTPVWPYDVLLASLEKNVPTETVAANLTEALGKFYADKANRGDHLEVPMTLLRLEKVQQLVQPLKTFQEHLYEALNSPDAADDAYDALKLAFRGAVDGDPLLVDVRSLCDQVSRLGIQGLTAAAEQLARNLDSQAEGIVSARRPLQSPFHGVSVYYYPASPEDRAGSAIGQVFGASYKSLRLSMHTDWHKVALADTPSAIAQRLIS